VSTEGSAATSRLGTQEERRDQYFRSLYGTVVFSVFVVLLLVAPYPFFYHRYFPEGTPPLSMMFGTLLLWILLGIFSYVLATPTLFDVNLGAPEKIRAAFMPIVAVMLIGSIALVCAMTGGAMSSPFSHLLTAVAGLATAYAKRVWTRGVIGASTIAAFWYSGRQFFAPCSDQAVANLCPSGALPNIIVFHCLSLGLVIGLAIVATKELRVTGY
jgi:hypothetical protein